MDFLKKTAIIFLVVALLMLTGCKKKDKVEPVTNEQIITQITQAATPPTTARPVQLCTDYLTGLQVEGIARARPVAVTVNNVEASLPQYGVSDAGVIMEFPVEGGITRLLALYSDYSRVPEVCSVRSCRYYFPIFAKGFGAVYFCFGSNELLANPILDALNMDYIDGNKAGDSLVFERDSYRLENYSTEHTVYIKGGNMGEIFNKYGFSTSLAPEYGNTAFEFSALPLVFSTECTEITAEFSSYYSSYFEYDSEKKVYYKYHNGSEHMDSDTGKQLSFTNLLMLETESGLYGDTNLVELDWYGGTGYYATMGTVREITWQKANAEAPVKIFDENGIPLQLNTGKTYMAVAPNYVYYY